LTAPRQLGVALVIGGRGAIGAAVAARLREDGFQVLATSRDGEGGTVALDPATSEPCRRQTLSEMPPLDAVVWAHGVNVNDAVGALDLTSFQAVLDGNLRLVVDTLDALIATGRLRNGARLVVLSSVWEQVARPGKFSYTVSKAALGGLIRAAALDLASRQVLVNAVLPGVVDTPMTRSVLSAEQVTAVAGATGFGRLVDLKAVASTVAFLCSPSNTAITGQSIAVDLGFSIARPL
jgi:3-oxoacyl-[acyl-carrier protein] reductase